VELGEFWGGAGVVLASTLLVTVGLALTLLLTARSDDP
jgi:hypothetical protein